MSSIRVGLSTTTIEPRLTGGFLDGIGVYSSALMRGLPAAGCGVTGYSFPPLPSKNSGSRLKLGQVMPHSFAMLAMRDFLTGGAIRCDMPVDIFHATDYRIVRMNCPVVATLHDAVPLTHPEWASRKLRRIKNWVQKNVAGNADHVIALSRFTVTELVEAYGVDERRITVVHCGVDAKWLERPPQRAIDETLRALGVRPGYFLFVGTLQPRKNVERIVEAYLGLPEAMRRERQLVIVGRAGWECDELLNRMRAAVQNGEAIVWINDLKDEERLRHVYAGAGVFVFPSLYEGFGIPVLEAFASGVPVVTANTTSLPEVSEGAALEVNPLDVGAIRDAMHRLASDESLRNKCIDAGHVRAARLTWERTVDETVAVYRTVLGRQ
ncbi:MAG TPA: glycosyltransferase family 1 protein [Noviherbaspirillum sp.]|uniref:glycosyltransferase family 4 protein n=1 Tax=Noviherbaspirillum sp. TaxID=1926288 RepID=UPI002B49B0CA|nr:glycosyltransferase family 1 protein [Noviherbaspirillum sp.]HJV88142.1 glycosyltransferase family 1 protein [Noviherbaspirillum sp.]